MKLRFVITAGPTREFVDPIRFLSNPSTGRMGFAVAAAAARRGHDVVLVAGPVELRTPRGVERRDATSARDMLAAVEDALAQGDKARTVFVATAAVADWRPREKAPRKLKKGEMPATLELVRNPDILKSVKGCLLKVGFAAETGDVLDEARRKCAEKGLALVVANDVTQPGAGFGTPTNRVVFITPDGAAQPLPLLSKAAIGARIVRFCERAAQTEQSGGR